MENGKIVRISDEMAELLKETAMKNDLSMRAVSKQFARRIKQDMKKDKKINMEIKF